MKKKIVTMASVALAVCASRLIATAATAERRLSMDDYRNKMQGGWIGQIAGVSFGASTEFKFRDEIVPEKSLPAWRPEMINDAFNQDDIYVEMTFLRTLEQYGLDASVRQAGIDFANSEYKLWCANLAGRTNLRKGIAPPDSSHPKYNSCPNDIDYQIEADYAGLIAPGCPQEVIRLGETFGRLMNFGDGVWAGQFVGALYAAAFFTSDVDALLDEGLKAIPAESDYAQMVRSVRAWRKEFPSDWTKAWEKVRATYSKRLNPALRDTNGDIDVRLNGAAVVLGLVYGDGDFDRSMVIATRCGWDSDCNPSSVCGVLGCAKGLSGLDRKYTEKIDRETKFSYTSYNLPELFAVCEKLMRQIVVRDGGRIEKAADGREWIVLPEKTPVPSPFVPSWKAGPAEGLRYTDAERAQLTHALRLPDATTLQDPDPTIRVQKCLDALWPGWKTSKNGKDMNPGYREWVNASPEYLFGCVLTHPPKRDVPVTLSRTLTVPEGNPRLHFTVGNSPKGDFRLVVRVNGTEVLATVLDKMKHKPTLRPFQTFDLSLEPWAGKTVTVELVQQPTGWEYESAVWHDIRITSSNGV